MSAVTTYPTIRLPQDTTTIHDVIELPEEMAVEVIREAVDGNPDLGEDDAAEFFSNRAHEEADRTIIYYDDQWGIVMSNYFGPKRDVDSDDISGENDGLDKRIATHAYLLARGIYEEVFMKAFKDIKTIREEGAEENDGEGLTWDAAIQRYTEGEAVEAVDADEEQND